MPGEKQRDVYSDRSKNHHFCNNFITTSKYTWWNFIPKNLFLQFHRVSNIYFLFNMCIALVPGVSPISPLTAILPLVFVLGVALIKDGYEDYQRHKADYRWNSAPGKRDDHGHTQSGVLREGVISADVPSRDIRVGDIVKMVRGEVVRADTILLASSDAEEHTCFIETMQLDGETNAKLRQAAQTTIGTRSENLTASLTTPEAFQGVHLHLQCPGPSPDLHDWTGKLSFGSKSEGVNISQFLYRGCVITNTPWVLGMVVYTGVDTKMQRNNKPKAAKSSKLDEKLNKMILTVLVIQHLVIFLLCALSVVYQEEYDSRWYIDHYLGFVPVELFFWRYMTYFILMSFMIPISLFVTIELCKAAQALFMMQDLRMQSWLRDANNEVVGDKPMGCEARTSNLNEQLAIVRYVFSDKTGTLTENRMQFHTGEVGNPERQDLKTAGQNFVDIEGEPPQMLAYLRDRETAPRPPLPTSDGTRSASHLDNVMWYMMTLAMCHELTILSADDSDATSETPEDAGPKSYQGASPDEVALAKCAQRNGVAFVSRSSGSIAISVLGDVHEYRLIETLQFTSKRKMMSIILQGPCRRTGGGELVDTEHTVRFCLTKGADTVMIANAAGALQLEKQGGVEAWRPVSSRKMDEWYQAHYHQRLWNELCKLGQIGLRTLVLAYKPLPASSGFDQWHERYSAAKKLVQPDARQAEMEECWSQMEQDFYITGATAIEDKLQDRVPDTVDFLLRAGIVVWMLTGDKQETAETIAGTARLVDKSSWDILYLSAHVPAALTDDLSLDTASRHQRAQGRSAWLCGLAHHRDSDEAVDPAPAFREGQLVGAGEFLPNAIHRAEHCRQAGKMCAVVTDGGTLSVICPPGPSGETSERATAAVESMWHKFTELAQMVNSGILCRLTPEQKGKIVRVFQQTTGHTALAVGDGANDVPMINESFVGIGIMGLEGSQAVLASDYAVPRFKHLKRLLFVHGRYSLYRNSITVLFSFYKNFVLAAVQVYFAFYCGFSGQTLFDSWLLAFQNLAFTSIPPLFVGIFEKDIDEDTLERYPSLYTPLAEGLYFDRRTFGMWFGESVLHSVLVFFLTYTTMRNDDVSSDSGKSGDVLLLGALTLSCQICTVLTKLALHIRTWIAIQAFGIAISFLMYVCFLMAYSSLPVSFLVFIGSDHSFYGSGFYLLADPKFWLWSVFFIVGVIITMDMAFMYIQRQHFPSLRDIAQRQAKRQRTADVAVSRRTLGTHGADPR